MSKRPRRNHAPAFKAKVALEALKGNRTVVWNQPSLTRFIRTRLRRGRRSLIRVPRVRVTKGAPFYFPGIGRG